MFLFEAFFRLVLALVFSGIIGAERERKQRPAGMKTHIIVGLGAALLALLQSAVTHDTIKTLIENPELIGAIRSDPTRLIAQVVSGVGFLGAGTIIVTKSNVLGLTTAATVWGVACLGLVVGMGYYEIAGMGFVMILATLMLLRFVKHKSYSKRIKLKYYHSAKTQELLMEYFKAKQIEYSNETYQVDLQNDRKVYTSYYLVEIPREIRYTQIVEDLSEYKDLVYIDIVNV